MKPSHRRKLSTPATQLRTRPTGNPDSLGLDHDPNHAFGREGPDPGQPVGIRPFLARSHLAGRDPAVLFGERPDPVQPVGIRPFCSGTAEIRLFWPENGVAGEIGSGDGKRI
jgi:hypothetical protein